MKTKRLFAAWALIGFLMGVCPVFADSLKLVYPRNGHAYQRFDTTALTWSEAKAACVKLGAHLVTLTGSEEDAWLYGNLSGNYSVWMGATDEAQEGVWTWITGEAWAYESWGFLQPDNDYPGQDYLLNSSGGWVDDGGPRSPSAKNYYICEWEARLYLNMVAIGDTSRDNKGDYAMLVLEGGNYRLYFIGFTGVILKNTALGTASAITPKAISLTDDINNNGYKDIAVLLTHSYAYSTLRIYDGLTASLLVTRNLPK